MSTFDNIFYALSRKWGQPATVTHKERATLNPATGKQEIVSSSWMVKRAILMEVKEFRKMSEQLGANYGGYYDQNKRIVIIPNRLVPKGATFNTNDQVVINAEPWRVQERITLPFTCALVAAVERVTHEL